VKPDALSHLLSTIGMPARKTPLPKKQNKSKAPRKPKKTTDKEPEKAPRHRKFTPRNIRSDLHNALLKRAAARIEQSHPISETVPSFLDEFNVPGNLCVYCDTVVKPTNVDEMVAITKGGRVNHANMVPCCGSCNSSKGNKYGFDMIMWLIKRESVATKRSLQIADYMERNLENLRFEAGRGKEEFEKCEGRAHTATEHLISDFEKFVCQIVD
jgi:5-methylcytosine-specific restriction endonuclease McrA